jgi:hypothetical protein
MKKTSVKRISLLQLLINAMEETRKEYDSLWSLLIFEYNLPPAGIRYYKTYYEREWLKWIWRRKNWKRAWNLIASSWAGSIPDLTRTDFILEVIDYDYEKSDPRYAGHRRDALRNRRLIPANTMFVTKGLLTIRRPVPNGNRILGGI